MLCSVNFAALPAASLHSSYLLPPPAPFLFSLFPSHHSPPHCWLMIPSLKPFRAMLPPPCSLELLRASFDLRLGSPHHPNTALLFLDGLETDFCLLPLPWCSSLSMDGIATARCASSYPLEGITARMLHRPLSHPGEVLIVISSDSSIQVFHGERELFSSDHLDWCDVSTIDGICYVRNLKTYQVLPNWSSFSPSSSLCASPLSATPTPHRPSRFSFRDFRLPPVTIPPVYRASRPTLPCLSLRRCLNLLFLSLR